LREFYIRRRLLKKLNNVNVIIICNVMKIAVLGATGPSGVQVVKEALARGHDVTAVVRNPDKLTEKHEKLKVCRNLRII